VFLETRDFELIRLTFEKFSTKQSVDGHFKISSSMISRSYRQYNTAYFEEIILQYQIEERKAMNYRERFLIDSEAKY